MTKGNVLSGNDLLVSKGFGDWEWQDGWGGYAACVLDAGFGFERFAADVAEGDGLFRGGRKACLGELRVMSDEL